MTTREIRTYDITCDVCGATARYESSGWQRLPAGWVRRESCGHGASDYCKDVDLCPACGKQGEDR